MLPDAPTTCPICGAAMSHDAPRVGDLRARIFNCGATVCDLAKGEWEVTLYCDKTGDLLRQLRADNVRIGDRNVLLAIATQGAIEALEDTLQGWATQTLETLPKVGLLRLSPIRAAYDELVDALEGAAPAPAAEVPHEPLSSGSASLNVSAAEHVGERSCTNSTPG